ncbi:pantetheine-phosphate adenylyltransferase [Hwanghaeella grinnelliae]|uniref:Phosphopantetheine adenylyltransferase n=1 Tax=Hwanghaeella grinnelliae TaxID=2500179 RepID=A0A437QX07_9PROT|nr:pantetheine-phosphate adenylyltransferase [Hwanghaeella grinnelliae]RVU39068.1 pantetheine-phosphate adenylyltransferase [Hwanghaeella grinnelliae]
MSTERVAIYPGTFDPITNGHMDIITRAARHMCDRLIVSVAVNAGKGPLFSLEERTQMVQAEIDSLANGGVATKIEVRNFDSLLIHYAQEVGATMIVRGLRAISDFEYEFQMVGMNARLNKNIETVFLMSSERNQFISSRLVKEIASLGGDVSEFVSPRIVERLKERLV